MLKWKLGKLSRISKQLQLLKSTLHQVHRYTFKKFTFNSRKKKFEKNDKYNIDICNFEKSYKA